MKVIECHVAAIVKVLIKDLKHLLSIFHKRCVLLFLFLLLELLQHVDGMVEEQLMHIWHNRRRSRALSARHVHCLSSPERDSVQLLQTLSECRE